jgi:hypothetical protein
MGKKQMTPLLYLLNVTSYSSHRNQVVGQVSRGDSRQLFCPGSGNVSHTKRIKKGKEEEKSPPKPAGERYEIDAS